MTFARRSFDGPPKRVSKRPYIIGAVILALLLAWLWYRNALGAVDPGGDARVSFAVPAGAGLSAIAEDLEEKGLVKSSFAFKTHVRLNGRSHLLRAGAYVLQPSMTASDILEVLAGGAAGEVSVTIPEGFTVADVDRLMASKGFTETGAVLDCAKTCDFSEFTFLPPSGGPGGTVEGYLYPDTYFVGGEGSDPRALLARLLSTFETKVVDGLADEIAASGKPLHEIMTMASLIEEEAANNAERPVISGILWKRLEEGIILGVDAAVRYAVGKRTEPLTRSDLEIDSPYNIRARQGLPPGPIANPGLASVRAALNPEASPYYYYLHGNDGNIHYAVTNEEHNQNRVQYLQ